VRKPYERRNRRHLNPIYGGGSELYTIECIVEKKIFPPPNMYFECKFYDYGGRANAFKRALEEN